MRKHWLRSPLPGMDMPRPIPWRNVLPPTGGRITSRLTPAIAAKMVEFNVAKRLTLVSLTQAEIAAALKTAASVGVRGGAIYDVLLLAAARKCGADRIHTLNHRHFAAFAPDLRDRLYDGQTSR